MAAPIYLKVADVAPRPLRLSPLYVQEPLPERLLRDTWGFERQNRDKIGTLLQSSFKPEKIKTVCPERNGFVGTVITAYGQHHHFIIRPDNVWLAILTQLNFYINRNAEQLRHKFVAHEGQKTLHVETIEFTQLAKDMTKQIHNNVVDKELVDWVLPKFSTTTYDDTIVYAAALMATLKAYFVYEGGITCGIPSITIEGSQKDWQSILYRLDKLEEFGVEPAFWASLLRPILRKFVLVFEGENDVSFWRTMVNINSICGGDIISGWISHFCVWSNKGQWQGPDVPKLNIPAYATVAECPLFFLNVTMLSVGFFDFDLKLIDDIAEYDCTVVAGHVANLAEGIAQDTIRPQAGWFVFTKVTTEKSMAMQAKLKSQPRPQGKKRKVDVDAWKLLAYQDKEKGTDLQKIKAGKADVDDGSGCFGFVRGFFKFMFSPHRK